KRRQLNRPKTKITGQEHQSRVLRSLQIDKCQKLLAKHINQRFFDPSTSSISIFLPYKIENISRSNRP
ncbi:hypothetical protein, partial [Gluconobacter kondonii]|uniref:hypothetical protein n=1 Tax=Gluconobacter kondonii TaxID=941463 RepID=UPI001B8D983F